MGTVTQEAVLEFAILCNDWQTHLAGITQWIPAITEVGCMLDP